MIFFFSFDFSTLYDSCSFTTVNSFSYNEVAAYPYPINLNNLSDKIIDEIQKYINYVKIQEKNISNYEMLGITFIVIGLLCMSKKNIQNE